MVKFTVPATAPLARTVTRAQPLTRNRCLVEAAAPSAMSAPPFVVSLARKGSACWPPTICWSTTACAMSASLPDGTRRTAHGRARRVPAARAAILHDIPLPVVHEDLAGTVTRNDEELLRRAHRVLPSRRGEEAGLLARLQLDADQPLAPELVAVDVTPTAH